MLKGMAGTAVRHRVLTACSKTMARFGSAQRGNAGEASGACSANDPLGRGLKGDGEIRFKDRSLKGRYRLRRLLLHQEQSQDGSRESVVDALGKCLSRQRAAIARECGALLVANRQCVMRP